jgi:hypothetical protein
MRRIQIVKKLFFKLSDFERVRSHLLQCYESSVLQRNGNKDNLVPVTFPVKEVFPHTQKRLKPLVASLELWWDSNEIFGMPKGGLEPPCPFEHNALNVACLPISPLRLVHPCGQA